MGRDRILCVVAFCLAALLLIFNSWSGSILGSDDAIYASVARNALRDFDFLNFSWQGKPFLDKGPVLFWLLAASEAVFGFDELALRLPGIVAGLALMVAIYKVARVNDLSREASILAAMFALATNIFYFNARRPMTDIPATAFAMWGLYFAHRGAPVSSGFLFGLSALTKVTAPIPALVAMLISRFTRRRFLAVVTTVITVLPWHIYAVAQYGSQFIETYFGYHLLVRASSPLFGDSSAYIEWLIERDPFATGIFIVVIILAPLLASTSRGFHLAATLLVTAIAPLYLSATALPHYLVSTLPGACLLAGVIVDRIPGRIARNAALLAVGVCFVLSNMQDLFSPDYSSGTKEACTALYEEGDVERLEGTFELHDMGVSWYCDKQTTIFGFDEGFLNATRNVPMLRGFVIPLTPERVKELASRNALLITRSDRIERLISHDMTFKERAFKTRLVIELSTSQEGETE